MYKKYLLLGLVACFYGCPSPQPERIVTRSFYHWKGHFAWSNFQNKTAQELDLKQLYVRCFEIHPGLRGQPTVAAWAHLDWTGLPENIQIVPTVFILQNVFTAYSDSMQVLLAQKTAQSIAQQMNGRPFREVQIDCDWTKTSRDAYFSFLKHLKTALPGTHLSATIRLHQVKYRSETGVPPADRGLLMLYNLSDPARYDVQNSIYDQRVASRYLSGQKAYPLPLDLALPLFSWGVHFRDGRFQGFLHDLDQQTVENTGFMQSTTEKNYYTITTDTVYQNVYLRPGDRIRLEAVSNTDLSAAVTLAQGILAPSDTLAVSFFHLDSLCLRAFSNEQLNQIFLQMQHR